MQTIRTVMVGLGNVGRNFLRILEMKEARLAAQYGLQFQVVAAADSSGVAVDFQGFDVAALRRHKEEGRRVADLPGYVPEADATTLFDLAPDLELVMESSPVDLDHGDPGLGVTRRALARGIRVVLANKGPLVLAFRELHDLAAANHTGLAFSATVCGALPVINIGRRDLIAADVQSLSGIFNSTSNFILAEMAGGRSFDHALAEAQRRGIAEADPTLDVQGLDTANKLVIIANSFLGVDVGLQDVDVQGMTGVTTEELQRELARGNTVKLLATAERSAQGYRLAVKPTAVPLTSFMGQCDGWEMGIELHSDLYGRMYHKLWEREPLPTAAAMLRDAVNLFTG